MGLLRKIVLITMALAMVAVMVLTWGSVGSMLMAYGLVMLGSGLLYQKFITNQDEPDYQMEV